MTSHTQSDLATYGADIMANKFRAGPMAYRLTHLNSFSIICEKLPRGAFFAQLKIVMGIAPISAKFYIREQCEYPHVLTGASLSRLTTYSRITRNVI